MANLAVELGQLRLKNPVIVASGTYASGKEYAQLVDLNQLGALTVKTLTLKPVAGNKPPRIWETPSGLLNSIGLQNDGIDSWLENDLPFLKKFNLPIIASVGGETVEEYVRLVKILSSVEEVKAIELNISCPNVKAGGAAFGSEPKLAAEVVSQARLGTNKTLIAKLTPNVTSVAEVALACQRAGADVLSLINTVLAMAIDPISRRPRLGAVVGGLSGPAIKPIAVRMVWEVAQAVQIPVIGMGGIMDANDALEFFLAGAQAVAVGTANFIDPQAPLKIVQGLNAYLEQNGFSSINEIVGAMVNE